MDPRYKSPTTAVVDHDVEHEFRDLTTLTSVLMWMLRIGAALAVLSIWAYWRQLEWLADSSTTVRDTTNDRRLELFVGSAVVLMITTFIVFGRWIVLAHRNLPALGAQHLEVRPGWAVGFFFVPILNWWKPYQAMRSLWRHSRSVNRADLEPSTWVLPAWWAAWVIWSLHGNASLRMQSRAQTLAGLDSLTEFELVGNALYLCVCLVASVMVSRIWQAQVHQRDNPEEAPRGFADAPAWDGS